jgi:hypothetical protein
MDIKCIYCKVENLNSELSKEHIIPEVLGGVFSIPYVCKAHNNKFGHVLEGSLKKNAFITTALDKLKLQPPNLAYREANVKINLGNGLELKGHIDKNGNANLSHQEISYGHFIVPEEITPVVLKKQIERFQKKSGKTIDFNVDEFNNIPFNIAIPIYGTDIFFEKKQLQAGTVMLHGLDQPISFHVIAKIALNHLTALDYQFVMKDEFDAIKNYILFEGINQFVMLHTILDNVDPKILNYLPFHYIRIKFIERGLAAIVCLFGTIKFIVFFSEFSDIEEFKSINLLDIYHVYDINNKSIFKAKGDDELREWDDMLLRSVVVSGKYAKNRAEEL